MDFVYRPEVAADITEYVDYISPVEGVKQILEKEGSDLAKSEIVFPSEEFTAKCTGQNTPPGAGPGQRGLAERADGREDAR